MRGLDLKASDAASSQDRLELSHIYISLNTLFQGEQITPDEIEKNLTPLMLEICVDGICLFGKDFFEPLRIKALKALHQSGLVRRRIGREWCWEFKKTPTISYYIRGGGSFHDRLWR